MPVCRSETPRLLPLRATADRNGGPQPLVACHLYSHAPAEVTV
jgi:hypothetical protein